MIITLDVSTCLEKNTISSLPNPTFTGDYWRKLELVTSVKYPQHTLVRKHAFYLLILHTGECSTL
jgi:hypothetical protein